MQQLNNDLADAGAVVFDEEALTAVAAGSAGAGSTPLSTRADTPARFLRRGRPWAGCDGSPRASGLPEQSRLHPRFLTRLAALDRHSL